MNEGSGTHAVEGGLVLLVEDNPADVFLVREALKLHELNVDLSVCDDGEKAVQWIRSHGPPSQAPVAVVLDLNLPRRSGADVLEAIRSSACLRDTPVIIFTSSNSQRDRDLQHRYPNTRYLRKSADFDEFMRIGELLKEALGPDAGRADA
ncbi:MAG: response regulator [Bryobacteraceae bacterium]